MNTPLELFDTHAHLYYEPFENDRDDVFLRSTQAGVKTFINIIMGPQTDVIEKTFQWAQNIPEIYFALGVHPHDASKFDESTLKQMEPYYSNPKMKAVGEIGLDYFYENSPKDAQIRCFEQFLEFSKKINLPVCIHTRDAFDDTYALLKNARIFETCGGVIHCFTDDWKNGKKWLDAGAYLSYSGIVTFKKALNIQEAARNTPLSQLLIETDAPFLAPEPHRGKRNEPAFIVRTAEYISGLKGITLKELAETTTRNAKKLFQI